MPSLVFPRLLIFLLIDEAVTTQMTTPSISSTTFLLFSITMWASWFVWKVHGSLVSRCFTCIFALSLLAVHTVPPCIWSRFQFFFTFSQVGQFGRGQILFPSVACARPFSPMLFRCSSSLALDVSALVTALPYYLQNKAYYP